MACTVAVFAAIATLICLAAGQGRADGTGRTLLYAVAAGLFMVVAFWFGLLALGAPIR
jgi:hypothetical protein